MGLLGKIIDPIGHTVRKKVRDKIGLDWDPEDPLGLEGKLEKKAKEAIGFDFEKFHFKNMWEQIKDSPERLLSPVPAVDPLGTKIGSKLTGQDWEPLVNQLGGPTDQRYIDYIEQGGDPDDVKNAQIMHQIAAAVASWYAGGALAGAAGGGAGGAAAGAGGSGVGSGLGALAAKATPAMMRAAIPVAAKAGDELFPPEIQEMLINAGFSPRGLTAGLPGLARGGYMNYAGGGEVTDPQVMMETIQEVTSIPGGGEMLMSQLAQELQGNRQPTKQLRMYNQQPFAGGGLASAAAQTQAGGRGDDEVLLHVSPEEYEAIVGMWGEPDINPQTGLPEYGFLSDVWKKVKGVVKKIVKSPIFQFVAPMALNAFFPGAGGALGKALGMSGKLGSTVGNALIRGGIGAAGGGKEGALSGVVSGLTAGGAGADIGGKLGLEGVAADVAGNAIIGGIGGEVGGGGFAQGALGNVMNAAMQRPMEEAGTNMLKTIFDPQQSGIGGGTMTGDMSPIGPDAAAQQDIFGTGDLMPQNTGAMSPVPGGAPQMSEILTAGSTPQPWYQDAWDWTKDNPLIAGGAVLLGANALGDSGRGDLSGSGPPKLPDNFLEGIPDYTFDRGRTPMPDDLYYTYGIAGGPSEAEFNFFTNNTAGTRPGAGGQPLPGTGGGGGGGGRGGRGGGRGGRGGGRGRRNQQQQPPGALPTAPPTGGSYLPGLGPDGSAQAAFPLEGQNLPTGYLTPAMVGAMYEEQGMFVDYENNMVYPAGGYQGAAQGGYMQGGGHSRGSGSGRDDTIEALLSDGEYVMDAETVALLGDGSNDAGAERLDEMREELRQHKGKNLSRGRFSHDAKRPMQYMKKGGGVTVSKIKKIAKKLDDKKMGEHVRHPKPKGHGSGTRGGQHQQSRYKKGGKVRNPLMHARLMRIASEQGEG